MKFQTQTCKCKWSLFFVLLALAIDLNKIYGCSSFLLSSPVAAIFTKNYDWHQGNGYLLTNKRKMAKRALMVNQNEVGAEWTSKYSSVTFNQYGQEFPNGGINEAGLAVEILWLDESVYPEPDERPAVNELQWVQYQLDNFSSTKEVLQSADKIRIANVYAHTHYHVCDKGGSCAVLEYLKGKLTLSHAASQPYRIITNDTYASSLEFLKRHKLFGGDLPIPTGKSSLDRFVRGAYQMKCAEASVDRAFDILGLINQPDSTQWSVAYDLTHQEISFQTLKRPARRVLKTSVNNGSCLTPVLSYDLEAADEGQVSDKFQPFTKSLNAALIARSLEHLGDLGKALAGRIANYPETNRCTETLVEPVEEDEF